MQTVNWRGKEITLICSGDTPLIFLNEFNEDIFDEIDTFLNRMRTGKPSIITISKLFYSYAKTANPSIFKSYSEFMKSIMQLSELNDGSIVSAVLAETCLTLGVHTKESEDDDSKKKKSATKKEKK